MTSAENLLFIICAFSLFLPFSICLAVFLFTFVYVLYNNNNVIKTFLPQHSFWFYLFFIYAMAVAIANHHWLGVSLTCLMFGIVLFGFFLQYFMTEDLCKNIIDIMAYMNIAALIAALVQKIPDFSYRSVSFFANANYYAYVCEIILLAFIYAIYKFGPKPIYFISIASSAAGILCAGCRSAWIAILVGVIVLLICLKKYRHLLYFAIFAACVCSLIFGIPKIFFPRETVFEHDKNLRFLIWHNAWGFIQGHPLFGQGLMSYYTLTANAGRPHDFHSHNLILDILVNFGFIGAVILIIFVVLFMAKAIKKLKVRPMGAISIAALAATFAHGFTDIPFFGLTTFCVIIVILSFAGYDNKLINTNDEKEVLP